MCFFSAPGDANKSFCCWCSWGVSAVPPSPTYFVFHAVTLRRVTKDECPGDTETNTPTCVQRRSTVSGVGAATRGADPAVPTQGLEHALRRALPAWGRAAGDQHTSVAVPPEPVYGTQSLTHPFSVRRPRWHFQQSVTVPWALGPSPSVSLSGSAARPHSPLAAVLTRNPPSQVNACPDLPGEPSPSLSLFLRSHLLR